MTTQAQPDREDSYHYQVIRRALDVIDSDAGRNLSLDDLAAQMQMSPAHFQRLFSQWVGVSPKRFQQYLTLGHAKSLISDRYSTLDTAYQVGLSGSGRLHDLFLRWEAMSPGDYAKQGADLMIFYATFETPFGPALFMGTDKGLCGIAFTSEIDGDAAFKDLSRRWPKATYRQAPDRIAPWVRAAFTQDQETPIHLIGAPFQIKVWEALLRIPSGHVTTYGDIATAIGNPRAVRAVGTAVGKNPLSWLIPCHRAIRKTGGLGGYHWGLPVKRAMLAYEAARADALTPS